MNRVAVARRRYPQLFFGLSFALIVYLFFRMLQPFLIAIALAATVVSLFYPNYARLNRRLGGRRSASALLMCTIVTLLIILPLTFFSVALFDELSSVYGNFQDQLDSGQWAAFPEWPAESRTAAVWEWLSRYLAIEDQTFTEAFSSLLGRLAEYLLSHYSSILGGLGGIVMKFVIMIFSMFFFFKEGETLIAEIRRLLPLAPEYKTMLLTKLRDVIRATFLGVLATGLSQGFVSAVIFYFLGVQNIVLWATAMAFSTLVPIVGTALVWVPMAVYFLLSGDIFRGIALLILGGAVISVVDNLVRPLVIEGRSEGMHLLLVFFSLLGGLMFFGMAGLILGPLVAALFVTFLEIYKIEFRTQLSTEP